MQYIMYRFKKKIELKGREDERPTKGGLMLHLKKSPMEMEQQNMAVNFFQTEATHASLPQKKWQNSLESHHSDYLDYTMSVQAGQIRTRSFIAFLSVVPVILGCLGGSSTSPGPSSLLFE